MKHGEELPQSKLTDANIRRIRRRLKKHDGLLTEARKHSPQEIAKEYGVCRRTVERIETGAAWGHVK